MSRHNYYIITFMLLAFFVNFTATPSNAQSETVAIEVVAEAPINRLASPRDAVRLFMTVMNEVKNSNAANIDVAISTLHLEEIPLESRSTRGIEMANQLFELLNSFTFKIDAIPVDMTDKKYSLPLGKELGIEITLNLYENQEWKFNFARTLKRLPAFLEIIQKNQKADTEDTTIDPMLFSPRQTMSIFMAAMGSDKKTALSEAANTLDLSRFERAVRREIGAERAAILKFVIDHYKFVDLVEIPNERQGPPFVFLAHESGRIVLEKVKNADSSIESWKFSAQTVHDLPQLYDAFKDKPLVDGAVDEVEIPLSVRVRDYMSVNFPSLMRRSFLLENWQWLGMFCIVFIGLALSRIITHLMRHFIKVVFRREAVAIDNSAEDRFIKPISITLTTLSWWLGLSTLGLPGELRVVLVVAVKLVTGAAGIWAGYRLMDVVDNFLMGKAMKTTNKFDDLLVPLITRGLKTIVIIIGLLFIGDIFAIDLDKVLAGLGLGGLAFALAAKDTISNIFGSLTILIDRPFQIGDWVTIGSADGTVESVGVRSTRIRTFYDSLITIPNSELINAQIDNYGARQYRRITATINVAYDTPPEKIDGFCEAVRELIRKHPYTRKDFYLVSLNDFGASALGIMLYCFVRTPDWSTELREKHRLFSDIIKVARALGVEFALSGQTLYLRNQEMPVHDNIPANELAAFAEGKETAERIVFAALGNPPTTPPPVKF